VYLNVCAVSNDSPCTFIMSCFVVVFFVLVGRIQVHKVIAVSQSKSSNVWIQNTVFTGYTWSPLTSRWRRTGPVSKSPHIDHTPV
jgi:hypothetical protein